MWLQAANFRLSHRFVVLNASGKEVSTAGMLRPRVHGWHCSQPGGSAQELALLCSSEAAALPPTATIQCELRVDQPLALDTVGGGGVLCSSWERLRLRVQYSVTPKL